MCLDNSAVRLRFEFNPHIFDWLRHAVEPARELRERQRKIGGLMHEQRADHLCPGGPALDWRRNNDIAGPRNEVVPAAAVEDRRLIFVNALRPFHAAPGVVQSVTSPSPNTRAKIVSTCFRWYS